MIYKAKIELSQAEITLYNRLLEEIDFDDDTKEMQDKIAELGAKQDDQIGIYSYEFENGNYVNIDICSGSSNYYDNIVLFDKNGNELWVNEYDFRIDSFEFELDDDTYIVEIGEMKNEL